MAALSIILIYLVSTAVASDPPSPSSTAEPSPAPSAGTRAPTPLSCFSLRDNFECTSAETITAANRKDVGKLGGALCPGTRAWYTFVAPEDGAYVFEISVAALADTYLSLYKGDDCGTLDPLDTDLSPVTKKISFSATEAQMYWVEVTGSSVSFAHFIYRDTASEAFPECDVDYPLRIGDGHCDNYWPYNSIECGYDGGDCRSLPSDGTSSEARVLSGVYAVGFIGLIGIFGTTVASAAIQRLAQSASGADRPQTREARRELIASYLFTHEIKEGENAATIARIVVSSGGEADGGKEGSSDHSGIMASMRSAIASLRSKNEPECSICICEFAEGESIAWSRQADCNHIFHADCVTEWLCSTDRRGDFSNSCPLCRRKILFDEVENT